MAVKISDLSGVIRPLATDTFEAESVAEGSVKFDFPTLLAGYQLPPVFQQLGYTISNVVEVDTLTKAAHVTLRPPDIGSNVNFCVSHHAVGWNQSVTSTTGAIVLNKVVCGFWTYNGIAALNKCTVALCTSAVVGARTGTSLVRLRALNPEVNIGNSNLIIVPSFAGPGNLGPNIQSLRGGKSMPPMLVISFGSGQLPSGNEGLGDLGSAVGSCRTLIGEQNIPPTCIFDASLAGGYQPYSMLTQSGFDISIDIPAAVTSQTVNLSCNLVWDEWVPMPSDFF